MQYTLKCHTCQKEFESFRPHSKFCSSNCRKQFSRIREEKKLKIIKQIKEIKSQPARNKGYPLSEEEKLLVKETLSKEGLLSAPRRVREKWVEEAHYYKPFYYPGEFRGGKSKYMPHPITFGAG